MLHDCCGRELAPQPACRFGWRQDLVLSRVDVGLLILTMQKPSAN
jgi:hypothetical protein